MGKGRDKRKRKAKKDQRTVHTAPAKAELGLVKARPNLDPPMLGEPDAPVPAPLKPRPHLRSGAIAISEPEPEKELVLVSAGR
jgi:hypothetical protein